jgi:hypothetical protein
LGEIRTLIQNEGPGSYGMLNANGLIGGARDAAPAQIVANVHFLIGLQMGFLCSIDPETVGHK